MKKPLSLHQGYFLILSVIFILVMGVMGVLMAYIFSSRALLSVHQQNGLKTFYTAESALEIAARYLSRSDITSSVARIACAAVTGNSQLTNAAVNGATFTVTTFNNAPTYAVTTLNGGITASATSLTLASSSGFASWGRITLDKEIIDYAGISGNTLIGLTRGVGGSIASSHANSAGVGQYQCSLNAQAGIPSMASPTYQRQLQWNTQLQDGWFIANSSSTTFTLANWNRSSELSWSAYTLAGGNTSLNLEGISMLSNANGWAVGQESGNNFTFLRWNGSAWSSSAVSGACSGQDLLAVSMVSSQEWYAVGLKYRIGCSGGGTVRRYSILKWNGSAWSALTPSSSPSIPADSSSTQDLYAVHVIDTNGDGLADVGFAVGTGGIILQYNGSNWVTNTSPTTQNLNGVFTVSATEAWAIGASGVIIRWNGTAWNTFTSPVTNALNAISLIDSNSDGQADFGVIAGASGRALTYNGSTWSATSVGGNNMTAAGVFNAQDAWLAGANGSLYHWDGSAWTSIASSTTRAINGMSLVRQGSPSVSGWRQIFS